LRPTPIDAPMELRGQVKEIQDRKVTVTVTLTSRDKVCAQGQVVAVQLRER
jgi:acyl-CoA thioesterase FadM